MQTLLNTIQIILQFSLGAVLGFLAWHRAGSVLSWLKTQASPISNPQVFPSKATLRITGPDLEPWPLDRAVLTRYGIPLAQVLDVKRVALPLLPLAEMNEVGGLVRGLYAEGRAPGQEMAQWVRGEVTPTTASLLLALRESSGGVPETWVLLVPGRP